MADALGYDMNSAVSAKKHLRALQECFDRENCDASFPKLESWPIAQCALWMRLALVITEVRWRFPLLGQRGIIKPYSRKAAA